MTTLDKNVWDSLDKVHLRVDALLQRTTTFPKVNVQTTPVSALDLSLAVAAAAACSTSCNPKFTIPQQHEIPT
jgi:hypothetical protein